MGDNHIKSFSEFINEGFIGKTLNRYKSGEERIEDKVNSNINTLEGIDLGLPFLIADTDLIINDKQSFTYEEMLKHVKFIESKGWRVPTDKDIDKLRNDIKYDMDYDRRSQYIILTSNETQKEVRFHNDLSYMETQFYWLYESYKWNEQLGRKILHAWFVEIDGYSPEKPHRIGYTDYTSTSYRIRLIKDK